MKTGRELAVRSATAAILLALSGGALGQAPSCTVPARLPTHRPDLPTPDQPRRLLPIGGYTLALTWSPQQCRRPGRDDGFRCAGGATRFGFTLHGLWPDGQGRDWPQYCRPARILPERTIRATLCATPSAQLIQHEWAKHGTCMPGETADRYFGRARAMFAALRFPDMDALSRRRGLTVADLGRTFAGANRGLTPAMLRVTTTRDGWLDEIWLCRDLRFRPVACPAHADGAAPGTPLRIWRGRR